MFNMINNVQVLLMYSKPYEIKDEETHEIKRGLSVEYYFFGKDGEGLRPMADSETGTLGIRRSKSSMDVSMKDKLMYVPGIYDGQFEMTVGADGKPVLKLIDIDYVGKCNMMFEPATPFNADASAEAPAYAKSSGKK